MLQTLLQKRSNGYYYFRWVCPPAIRKLLGKREIIKSLRTTSKIQALPRAGAYYMAVDRLKELALSPGIGVDASHLQVLESIFAEIYEGTVILSFRSFLNLSNQYQPESLKEAKQKKIELLKLIEAHRIAATIRHRLAIANIFVWA